METPVCMAFPAACGCGQAQPPHYCEIIKTPMDTGTVKNLLGKKPITGVLRNVSSTSTPCYKLLHLQQAWKWHSLNGRSSGELVLQKKINKLLIEEMETMIVQGKGRGRGRKETRMAVPGISAVGNTNIHSSAHADLSAKPSCCAGHTENLLSRPLSQQWYLTSHCTLPHQCPHFHPCQHPVHAEPSTHHCSLPIACEYKDGC